MKQDLCWMAIIVSLFLAIFGSEYVLSSFIRSLLSNRNPHTVEDWSSNSKIFDQNCLV